MASLASSIDVGASRRQNLYQLILFVVHCSHFPLVGFRNLLTFTNKGIMAFLSYSKTRILVTYFPKNSMMHYTLLQVSKVQHENEHVVGSLHFEMQMQKQRMVSIHSPLLGVMWTYKISSFESKSPHYRSGQACLQFDYVFIANHDGNM